MADIIQIRRDTSANWTSTNPTLAQGEIGLELTAGLIPTGRCKIGDGSSTWSALTWFDFNDALSIQGEPVNTTTPSDGDIFEYNGTLFRWDIVTPASTSHTRLHNIDAIADHTGITGTTNNFMSINASGLPQDSTYTNTSFVAASLEDTFIATAGRNNNNTTNIYLRDANGMPSNTSPFTLPFNSTLVYMSSSTNGNETWTGEVHIALSLITGAALSITAADSGYNLYSINFNAGDKVQLYCNGSSINDPRLTAIFRKRT